MKFFAWFTVIFLCISGSSLSYLKAFEVHNKLTILEQDIQSIISETYEKDPICLKESIGKNWLGIYILPGNPSVAASTFKDLQSFSVCIPKEKRKKYLAEVRKLNDNRGSKAFWTFIHFVFKAASIICLFMLVGFFWFYR